MQEMDSQMRAHRWLAIASVSHAATVFIIWLTAINHPLIPPKLWIVIGWLWFLWPIVLSFHTGRSLSRVLVPTIIGLAFLAPCLPSLAAFTAWNIHGFAP
jgi:hypothetical protein